MKQPIKTCSCGRKFYSIPANAKLHMDCVLPGHWFNCECGSTLVIPIQKPAQSAIKRISVAVVAMLLVACGGGGSSGGESAPAAPGMTCATLAGTYVEDFSGSVLVISANCTFTDSYCGYNASYSVPTSNPYAATVTIAGTNGAPGCMSSTAHTCDMGWDQNDLGVVCDGGAYTYLFHKQ